MLRHCLLFAGVLWSIACGGGTEPDPVANVEVSAPPFSSLSVGSTVQLVASVKSASGASLSGRQVTWSSSNQNLATVSTSGLVTGIGEGSVTITATSEGKSGSLTLFFSFPYPNVAGSYAYAATFDLIPSSTANGIGVVAIAQADRTKPDIQMAPLINWVVGTSSFNFVSAHAATITTQGGIAFRMGPAGGAATWQHTGTRTGTGGYTGRHTLADATSSNSGSWAMARTSGVQAMLIDRGLGLPGTAADARRALTAVIENR